MWVFAIPTNPCFLWFCSSQEFGETWNYAGEIGAFFRDMVHILTAKCRNSSSCGLTKVQPKFSRMALRSQCLISQQL